ncbi:MAG: class I SAM-dependent methyltransferase [Pirellulales bacterium]|nr:class I SAM-dependent methyltransferase [Pirellulales bacterium]
MRLSAHQEAQGIQRLRERNLPVWVTLADGTRCDVAKLDVADLQRLRWEEEQAWAKRILATQAGTQERAEVIRTAYDTVVTVMDRYRDGASNRSLGLNLNLIGPFVERLLRRQMRHGLSGQFFEIGFGRGILLKWLADKGFEVAGLDPSVVLLEQATELLGPALNGCLHLGTLLDLPQAVKERRFGLVYSNDVIEHIPPDEVVENLRQAYLLLEPRGLLVTVTPNWHGRPSDVTRDWCPPRTEAKALHLQEYSLRDMTSMLRQVGFRRVVTPLFRTHHRVVVAGGGFAGMKRLFEPWLEWLPYRLARNLIAGFSLTTTIAVKD